MKPLAWPRLLFTALVLAILFGVLARARGQPPHCPPQAPPPRPAVPPQAPPCRDAGGDCGCGATGRCACGADCPCAACRRPATRRADDGGPDWQWDWRGGHWYRPAPQSYAPAGRPAGGWGSAPGAFGRFRSGGGRGC